MLVLFSDFVVMVEIKVERTCYCMNRVPLVCTCCCIWSLNASWFNHIDNWSEMFSQTMHGALTLKSCNVANLHYDEETHQYPIANPPLLLFYNIHSG